MTHKPALRKHEIVERAVDKLIVAAQRVAWADRVHGMTPDQQQMVRMVIRDLARVSDMPEVV